MVSNSTSKRCPGQRRCQESEPSGNACVRTPGHGVDGWKSDEPIEVGSLFLSYPYFFVIYIRYLCNLTGCATTNSMTIMTFLYLRLRGSESKVEVSSCTKILWTTRASCKPCKTTWIHHSLESTFSRAIFESMIMAMSRVEGGVLQFRLFVLLRSNS